MLKTTLIILAIAFSIAYTITAAIATSIYKDYFPLAPAFRGRWVSLSTINKGIAECEDEHYKKGMIRCKKLYIAALTFLYISLAIFITILYAPKLLRVTL
ncbi:MAG: hypothetical protein ACTHJ0_02965 [Flavipsychrobacter sp.]